MLTLVENLGPRPEADVADTLTLTHEQRSRARLRVATDGGLDAGWMLERGRVLAHGDVLRADDGTLVRVAAAAEEVFTSRCGDRDLFARACYHVGNRHAPLEIGDLWMRYKPDTVLEELLRGLGLTTVMELAPFHPEPGAYPGFHCSPTFTTVRRREAS